MKTFSQLTAEQQENALENAKNTIRNSVKYGIIDSNKTIYEKEIGELAFAAVEVSFFDENGNIIEEVPPYFSGEYL